MLTTVAALLAVWSPLLVALAGTVVRDLARAWRNNEASTRQRLQCEPLAASS